MKNYLYKLSHKILTWPLNQVSHINDLIKQVEGKSIYIDFIEWILDVIQYGFVMVFISIALLGYKGFNNSILLLFAFGMLRWLTLSIIGDIKKTVNSKY